MELPTWEIDREGVERAMVARMAGEFDAEVAAGRWTQAQADQAVGALTRSKALQEAVDAEVAHMNALLNNKLH